MYDENKSSKKFVQKLQDIQTISDIRVIEGKNPNRKMWVESTTVDTANSNYLPLTFFFFLNLTYIIRNIPIIYILIIEKYFYFAYFLRFTNIFR